MEFMSDANKCDQSHHDGFRNAFCKFLRRMGITEEVVEMVYRTYRQSVRVKRGKIEWFIIKFLQSQLKTGMPFTSLANTIVIAAVIFAFLRLFLEEFVEKNDLADLAKIFARNGQEAMRMYAEALGMKWTVHVYGEEHPKYGCGTFHKGYFIPNEDYYLWVPLPGTTLAKMLRARTSAPMGRKQFKRRIEEGVLSRWSCAQNPIVRLAMKRVIPWYASIKQGHLVEDKVEFRSWIKADLSWWERTGDGADYYHDRFMTRNYEISHTQIEAVYNLMNWLETGPFRVAPNTLESGALLRMWVLDNS